jgi:nuclear transport factor 2 (NTF2) superfamily protein
MPTHPAAPAAGGFWEAASMSNQPLRKEGGHNPRTIEEARNLVKHVQSLFMPWNIDALVDGFTDDCIVRFGTLPEFRGKEALRQFFSARSAKQKGYRLTKECRSLVNDTMANIWNGEWEDVATGRKMKGYGVEVWKMRDGKIAVWEAAFNSAPSGEALDVAAMLG